MKRLNDLLSGKENINVKDVKVTGTNGLEILKDNNNNAYSKVNIQTTADGFDVKVNDGVVMSWFGGFTIDGSIFSNGIINNKYEPTNYMSIGDDDYTMFKIQNVEILGMNEAGLYVYKPLSLSSYTTALRPSTSMVSEGAIIYDSTLKKCILNNGTAWVNLDGTALA